MNVDQPGHGSSRFDLVALGEVMLRLDPGEGRVRTARSFRAWEGGGEYNVARGLRRCFGLKTAILTAFADNEVGRLLEDLVLQGGVDTSFIRWIPYDGVGRTVRNGLNFTERGFGVRNALGVPDRGHTAAAQLKPGDFDWDPLFSAAAARWLHTGGIFAALSESTAELVLAAAKAARSHSVPVSYDLNYRPSLWAMRGEMGKAREVNRGIAPYIDVMIGHVGHFTGCLGLNLPGIGPETDRLTKADFQRLVCQARDQFPNLSAIATTVRRVRSGTRNDWSGLLWLDGEIYPSKPYDDLEILDRVGGGDAFASGLIFGLLQGLGGERSIEYAAAHGALTMTTPGDVSMVTVSDVERLMAGRASGIVR